MQKYIYNKEKAVLEDALYATLTKKDDDQLKKDWIKGAHPYHIRHILAKVESGASDYTRGTITADQAIKLSNIGLALGLSNDTFGGIAYRLSEDEGSGKLYGDVGTTTVKASNSGTFSMVTEFQLAIYIYDALYAGQDATSQTYKDLIPEEVPSTVTTPATAFGAAGSIVKVPYEVFQLLASEDNGGYGDVTKNNNKIVGQGEEVVYPRNILWNKYLNHHEPFVITNELVADKLGAQEITLATSPSTIKAQLETVKDDWGGADVEYTKANGTAMVKNAGATGFVAANTLGIQGLTDKLGDTQILVDENNNPIFGVRSEYGIHFMIIQKSAFESEATLADWYQVYSPKQADYPKDGSGNQITSYVNYAKFDDDQMTSRASAIKDAIKGFDGSYQYRIYEELKAFAESKNRFNISEGENGQKAKELLDSIDSYITLQKEKNAYDQEVGYELAWDNFMLKYDQQEAERAKDHRIVPLAAAIGFVDSSAFSAAELEDLKALYEIGGLCYYGDKAQ